MQRGGGLGWQLDIAKWRDDGAFAIAQRRDDGALTVSHTLTTIRAGSGRAGVIWL